jgi:hypothetical protein
MAVGAATVKPLTAVGDRSEIALKTTAGPAHAVARACDAAEMPAAHSCPDSEVRIIVQHPPFANFGIEGHEQHIDLVWLWFRSPHFPTHRENDADF